MGLAVFKVGSCFTVSFLVLQSSYWGRVRERAGCFTFIFLLMSGDCYCSVSLPHGVVGWSVVCACGISCSYSLAFINDRLSIVWLL